jgi:hypothetical protein
MFLNSFRGLLISSTLKNVRKIVGTNGVNTHLWGLIAELAMTHLDKFSYPARLWIIVCAVLFNSALEISLFRYKWWDDLRDKEKRKTPKFWAATLRTVMLLLWIFYDIVVMLNIYVFHSDPPTKVSGFPKCYPPLTLFRLLRTFYWTLFLRHTQVVFFYFFPSFILCSKLTFRNLSLWVKLNSKFIWRFVLLPSPSAPSSSTLLLLPSAYSSSSSS